ncbi:MAG: F0F1 ATP synthase subunit delta [Pirellulaceae bacterium]|nr:F0F1 ATP synthase subunit delta [Pirellulaceae bacterium]
MSRTRQAKREARQLFRLCLSNGLLDAERVRQVVRSVSQSRNRNRFLVLARFRRLVELDCTRRAATIESAAPLPPAMRDDLQAALSRRYGPGLNFAFRETPALIGGLRVTVGNDVYDGSVQGRLAALSEGF